MSQAQKATKTALNTAASRATKTMQEAVTAAANLGNTLKNVSSAAQHMTQNIKADKSQLGTLAKTAGIQVPKKQAPAQPPKKAGLTRAHRKAANKEAARKAAPALWMARQYSMRAMLFTGLLTTGTLFLILYAAAVHGAVAYLVPLVVLLFFGFLAVGFALSYASLRPFATKSPAASGGKVGVTSIDGSMD